MRGNRTESLPEENRPPRGSLRGPPKAFESLRGARVMKTKSQREPLGGLRRSSRRSFPRMIFLWETLGPVVPHRVAPYHPTEMVAILIFRKLDLPLQL